jgi:hypothetical protein
MASAFYVDVVFMDTIGITKKEVCMFQYKDDKYHLTNSKGVGQADTNDAKAHVADMTLTGISHFCITPPTLKEPRYLLHCITYDMKAQSMAEKIATNTLRLANTDEHILLDIQFQSPKDEIHEIRMKRAFDDDENDDRSKIADYDTIFAGHTVPGKKVLLRKDTIAFNRREQPNYIDFIILEDTAVCRIQEQKATQEFFFETTNRGEIDRLHNSLKNIQEWDFVCIPHKSFFSAIGNEQAYTFHIDS